MTSSDLVAIWQWGGLVFVVFGAVFAFVGLFQRGVPLVGFKTSIDSVASRFSIGVGIAMVWPVAVAFLLGSWLLRVARASRRERTEPQTHVAPPEPDQHRSIEVEALERLLPTSGLISDLRDWDVRLYDEMGDDWFYEAAGGDASTLTACAEELTAEFKRLVTRLDLDYNQLQDPSEFDDLVATESETFIRAWRSNVVNHLAGRK